MPTSTAPPIVLTGCGWVTPLAAGNIGQVFAAARRTLGAPSLEGGYWAVPDDLASRYAGLSRELQGDKGAWLAGIAFGHACQEASLEVDAQDAQRVGLVLGSALAGQLGMIGFANEVRAQSARFVSPLHFPQTVGNYIAGALARGYKLRGPNLTLACGAASGLEAVAQACAMLAAGEADVVVAGGVSELSKDLAKGLAEPDATLSEGACLFVLERADSAAARGASPLAQIIGHSRSSGDAPLPADADRAIVSCASCYYAGAVFIEHWVGRCFGAAGAAALAAAIGAADGGDVPLLDSTGRSSARLGPVRLGDRKLADGSLLAIIRADADGAHITTVMLSLPPR